MILGPLELLNVLLVLALLVVPIVVVLLVVRRRRPAGPSTMGTPGWWPDPGGAPDVVRYFDGQRWTEETRRLDPPPRS